MRVLLLILLISLLLWFIFLTDVYGITSISLLLIAVLLLRPRHRNLSNESVRGYIIMIESALRRSEVPEKELTRIITNMTSEGRPSRANVLKILAHLNRAQTSAKTNLALQEVAKLLGMLGDATDASKVVTSVDEIARRLEEFEIESSISSDALDASMDVSSEDISAAMHEIDVEAGLASPGETAPASELDSLEEDIKELERELGM